MTQTVLSPSNPANTFSDPEKLARTIAFIIIDGKIECPVGPTDGHHSGGIQNEDAEGGHGTASVAATPGSMKMCRCLLIEYATGRLRWHG